MLLTSSSVPLDKFHLVLQTREYSKQERVNLHLSHCILRLLFSSCCFLSSSYKLTVWVSCEQLSFLRKTILFSSVLSSLFNTVLPLTSNKRWRLLISPFVIDVLIKASFIIFCYTTQTEFHLGSVSSSFLPTKLDSCSVVLQLPAPSSEVPNSLLIPEFLTLYMVKHLCNTEVLNPPKEKGKV